MKKPKSLRAIEAKARRIHIGRKAPKGYEELPGGVHLGRGIWALPIKKKEDNNA